MGGYQLAISQDIFRGRYRDSFANPTAIPSGVAQSYKFRLPTVNHVFQPGHRIMAQIQSSQFPLYDRNPKTFVHHTFPAQPGDDKQQEVTTLHSVATEPAVRTPWVRGDTPA